MPPNCRPVAQADDASWWRQREIAALVGPEREGDVKTAIAEGMAPYRRSDGSYRLNNEFHFLVTRKQKHYERPRTT